jgi:hypothetical protein
MAAVVSLDDVGEPSGAAQRGEGLGLLVGPAVAREPTRSGLGVVLDGDEEQLEVLQRAREYLAGALLCRYDHPATECKVMGYEIDRRLAER